VRWWNERHPSAWARAVAAGEHPEAGREALSEAEQQTERIMLRSRLADGLELAALTPAGRAAATTLAEEGIVEIAGDRLALTLRGRLLADHVTHRLDV
jgi:oxygen-independent coproporphyrinogen-3 oxidase